MLRQILSRSPKGSFHQLSFLSSAASDKLSETDLTQILKNKFADSTVKVDDISGGCGAMFEVHIKSAQFKGLSMVKQHQMVNSALKDEVKQMHGIRIFTQAP